MKKRIFASILALCLILTSAITLSSCLEPKALNYELSSDGKSYTVIGRKAVNNYNIEIPDEYKDLPVTAIEAYAFKEDNIKSVTIGKNVTSIGEQAFYGCQQMTKISIPDSITEVGNQAFYGCTNVEYSTYDNAKYLGNETNPYVILVEATDKSITSCNIHKDTKAICDKAFIDCTGLSSISIPDNVKSIGRLAFISTNLKSIEIPEGVVSISHVFSDCSALTSITLPSTLKHFWYENCNNLKSITFNGTMAQWEAIDGSNCVDDKKISVICSDGQYHRN